MGVIDGFVAFNVYLSLKNHFTKEKYDAIKYCYKTNAKPSTWENRNDRFQFQKIANRYRYMEDVVPFMVANFITLGGKAWIGDFEHDHFLDWKRRNEGISNNFRNDCQILSDKYGDIPSLINDEVPEIFNEYLGKKISPETVVIFHELTNCLSKIEDHPLLDTDVLLLKKYSSFVRYNKKKMSNLAYAIFVIDKN